MAGTIGKHDRDIAGSPFYFSGALDDFRYWNRAITEEEIEILCNEEDQTDDTNTGIIEQQSVEELIAYPNPTSGVVNFSIDTQGKETKTMTITDVTGKIIYNGNYLPKYDMSNLAGGLYTAIIYNDDSFQSVKILKQ